MNTSKKERSRNWRSVLGGKCGALKRMVGRLLLSGLLLLLFSQAAPAASSITNIRLSPTSPAHLSLGEKLNMTFDYSTDYPGGVRIWARPVIDYTECGSYAVSGSPFYPAGSGSGGNYSYSNCDASVYVIHVVMETDDTDVLLAEEYLYVDIKWDGTDPEVDIDSPKLGQYQVGTEIIADFSASDALSGIDNVDSTVANGQPVDTSTPGWHTFEVTATDKAGNETTETVRYLVKGTPSGTSTPDDNGILLQDSFEDGNADGWGLWDGWRVIQETNGNHVLLGAGLWEWAIPDRGFDWTDYVVRFRVKLFSGGVHMNVRLSELSHRTRYIIGLRENTTYIGKEYPSDNHFDLVTKWGEIPLAFNVWHDVEIAVQGARLTVTIGGILQLDYTDVDNSLLRGTIALETVDDPEWQVTGGSRVYVDDIEVRSGSSD